MQTKLKLIHKSLFYISPKLNVPSLNLNLPYGNSKINSSQICKYLGVLLDDKLNFKPHILEINLAKAVGILSKLRHILPLSALRLLYFSLIHPYLLYALPISEICFHLTLKTSKSSK